MTSRDDYPYIAWHALKAGLNDSRGQCAAALDEIDRLRAELERWKERAEEYRQNYWYQRMVTRER